MRVVKFDTDRENNPLMKDLHELGLRHGVVMVVVAVDRRAQAHGLVIDHRDDTTPEQAVEMYQAAGDFLMDLGAATSKFAAKDPRGCYCGNDPTCACCFPESR